MRPLFRRISSVASASSRERSDARGVALVIVLAFVVLLTVLVVAFFTRAINERQISAASAGRVKVDLLAEGAENTIIDDLKREISAGSIVTSGSVTNSGTNYTICVPTSQWSMVPCTSGTAGGAAWLPPNVLKRSANGQPFYSGTNYNIPSNYINATVSGATVTTSTGTLTYSPINRAAMVSSTAASLNGRYISLERWNKPLLIPTVSGADSTPLLSGTMANGANWAYAPPDWILVDRAGNNPIPPSTALPATLQWSSTASTTVFGRYAYTIYDEGGLLDMNVAGHPSSLSGTTASVKSSLAMADLTQIGLTASQIDAIVTNWRNQATAQESGNFRDNMLKISATNGFLGVNPIVAGDNAFPSRQSLINFLLQNLAAGNPSVTGTLQSALQYMATFSRSLEQPSFAPNPNRPRIINASSPPPPNDQADSYMGNNDGVGGDDSINPAFLSVRVTGAFNRFNGSPAVIGEPLVKYRFPLSRLAWITYAGPSAGPGTSNLPAAQKALLNVGVSQATINAGTASNIYNEFGLTWSGSTSWTYGHGASHIMTLSQVAAANREPDFAELLKAAIVAGSLGKAGPNLHDNQDNYQYVLDYSLDLHVLQIMANIIDQTTPDSFPTVIQFTPPGSVTRNLRGIKDLPYFYRYHRYVVVTNPPNPLLSESQSVVFPPGTPGISGTTSYTFKGALANTTLKNSGSAALLYVPEVWNPHDGSVAANSGARPTQFQVVAITQDPAGQTGPWKIGTEVFLQNSGSGQNLVPTSSYPVSNPSAAVLTGTLQFSDANRTLFREPTLLWRPLYPTGVSLGGNTTVTDANTLKPYMGILVATNPISMSANISGTNYVFQGNYLNTTYSNPAGSSPQVTFRLQYWNGSEWVTYDEKYPDLHALPNIRLIVNKNDFPNNQWENPLPGSGNGSFEITATCYDPRTARYGVGTQNTIGLSSGNPTLEVDYGSNPTNADVGSSNFTVLETERPGADRGNQVAYSNPGMTSDPGKNQQMRLFSGIGFSASNGAGLSASTLLNEWDGLWSQNNPIIKTTARDNSTELAFYYEDADGVARRAMGAYARTSLFAGSNVWGMPLATANSNYPQNKNNTGIGTPTSQNQSRPIVLNRPFRSVGEMSYAFRGDLWKQINFFSPESGDAALLDIFCVSETPSNPIIAGKVNLNTRNPKVLAAIVNGAYQDEFENDSGAPMYALQGLGLSNPVESGTIAGALVGITTDAADAWRGPLANIGELVGRFVGTGLTSVSGSDQYTFKEPVTGTAYTYSGFSGALTPSVLNSPNAPYIQRFREAAVRALSACGQTRVWNLMIDVIAQSGRYPQGTANLSQFQVEGEKRYWVHLAVDRYTGQIIDKQVEVVNE